MRIRTSSREKVLQLVPTHACESEELAVGLSLSLALHEGCLYFLLIHGQPAMRTAGVQDTPWLRRRSLVRPSH